MGNGQVMSPPQRLWAFPACLTSLCTPQPAFIFLHLRLQMWEVAMQWEFKAAAHETGSSRLNSKKDPAGRPCSPSAGQCNIFSSMHHLNEPGAAGRQIASPTNKLRLVEESLRYQRTWGGAAVPGSEPYLLQLLAAKRQTRLCRS